MKPNTKNAILAALLALALLALAGCAGSASAPEKEPAEDESVEAGSSSSYADNFVGEVPETEAFIAVVVDKHNQALAYVCDAKEEGPSALRIAEWFRGEVAEGGARTSPRTKPEAR